MPLTNVLAFSLCSGTQWYYDWISKVWECYVRVQRLWLRKHLLVYTGAGMMQMLLNLQQGLRGP